MVKFCPVPGVRNRKFYLAPGMRNEKICLVPNDSVEKLYLAVKGLKILFTVRKIGTTRFLFFSPCMWFCNAISHLAMKLSLITAAQLSLSGQEAFGSIPSSKESNESATDSSDPRRSTNSSSVDTVEDLHRPPSGSAAAALQRMKQGKSSIIRVGRCNFATK